MLGCSGTLARLGELGPPYGQHARLQVDIGILQMHRFGDTQTDRRDQAEQRLVGRPAQASRGAEVARCGQQVDDLLVAINVWGRSLADSTKDGVVRYLGVWLELLQVSGKHPNLNQAPGPSRGLVAATFVAARPVDHDFDGQRLVVAEIIDVTCEALYGVTYAAQAKPQLAALVQIVVSVRLHRSRGRAHAAHPGQGSATAARFLLSSLA